MSDDGAATADEAPGDEAPGDEAPADEAPADEAPADEAPADEAPGDADAGESGLPPAEDGWARETVAYRGISRRLAAHYLRNLGGRLVGTDDPAEATRVDGDGWRVALSAETVTAAAAIELTEVTAEFAGEPDALADLLPKYRQKAMRAGG